MSFQSTMRALTMLFVVFALFTILGALLTALLVRIEPMLLPTFSSTQMLMEYMRWRSWLPSIINYLAYALSVAITYILLLGGIRIASNVWSVYRGE